MKDFKKVENEFEEIKHKLKEIDAGDKKSGIYIMYIEDLNQNNLIPLYIGQSVNLYNRRTSHRGNTKKLFVLDKEEYNKQIPLNSGKYLYCKLVSTLKNNNKSLDDIKFKVIEYCEKEQLDDRELYWIEFFEANIYGFNQFQEIINSNKLVAEILFSKNIIDFNKIATEGIKMLKDFENKIKLFDENLLKYKYYSANYTLLLGNYNALYQNLSKINNEHSKAIKTDLKKYLDYTKNNLKEVTNMFMGTEYLKWGVSLFKEFEIN